MPRTTDDGSSSSLQDTPSAAGGIAPARAAAPVRPAPEAPQGRGVVLSVDDEANVRLAGRQVYTGDLNGLIEEIARLRTFRRPTLLVTSNVDQLLDLEDSDASLAAYQAADLVVLDGMPLVFLARTLGAPEVSRHTGADLLPQITAVSAERKWKIAILGGGAGVADQAAERLQEEYPGSSVSTVYFPMVTWVGAPEASMVIAELTNLDPDIVFVCLGAPKQEQWYLQWRGELPPAVYIGAGAAVDFAAGVHKRAPGMAQRLGFEWLWRVAQEPKRLAARYLVKGPRFLLIVLRSWLGTQLHLGDTTHSRVSRIVGTGGPETEDRRAKAGLPPIGRRLSDRMVRAPDTVASDRWRHRYAFRARVLDVLALVITAALATLLRFETSIADGEHPSSDDYALLSVGVVVVWLIALSLLGAYDRRTIAEGDVEYRRATWAAVSTFAAASVVSTMVTYSPSRIYLALTFGGGLIATLLVRAALRRGLWRRRARGESLNRVLVIGGKFSTQSLARAFARHPEDGFRVAGMWLPLRGDATPPTIGIDSESVPVWGWDDTLDEALRGADANTVIVTDTELLGDRGLKALGWALEGSGIDLLLSPNVVDVAGPRIHVRPVANLPLLHLDEPSYLGATRASKAIFDRTVSALALLFLLPVFLVIAICIKATSKGPVFYRSTRIGLNSEPFQMVKFRTMVPGADRMVAELSHLDTGAGPMFKIADDPRVTKIGRVLRRFSIDELPQLINVLKGEMSLVGPRPPLPEEVATWTDGVERRLLVPQGMTGLWQISGRSDLKWSQAVQLDLSYVENWSLLRDVQIIWHTIRAVTRSHGAY